MDIEDSKNNNIFDTEEVKPKKKQGFASLSPERRREIASMGGKKAHENGTAHKFTSEEAKEAGSKGGKSVSQDREHMREIGRKGGFVRLNKKTK